MDCRETVYFQSLRKSVMKVREKVGFGVHVTAEIPFSGVTFAGIAVWP